MSKKAKIAGIALLLLGAVFLIGSLWTYLDLEKQDAQAGESAAELLEQTKIDLPPARPAPTPQLFPDPEQNDELPAPAEPTEMPVKIINGYETVGILSVPKLGLELPILNNWNYDLLAVSPCLYSGTAAGGDLILMGHNYKAHFRSLKTLIPGDEITFTDMNGFCYAYVVDKVGTLHKSESELLASDHELIIFTCVLGGEDRVIVRCRRV